MYLGNEHMSHSIDASPRSDCIVYAVRSWSTRITYILDSQLKGTRHNKISAISWRQTQLLLKLSLWHEDLFKITSRPIVSRLDNVVYPDQNKSQI